MKRGIEHISRNRIGLASLAMLCAALPLSCKKEVGGQKSASTATATVTPLRQDAASTASDEGALREQLEALRKQMTESDKALAAEARKNLETEVQALKDQLAKTQQDTAQAKQETLALSTQIKDLEQRLLKSDADLAATLRGEIQTRVSALETAIKEANGKLAALEQQLADLDKIFVSHVEYKAEEDRQRAELNATMAKYVDARVDDLKSLLNGSSTALKQLIDTNTAKIDAQVTQFSALRDQVSLQESQIAQTQSSLLTLSGFVQSNGASLNLLAEKISTLDAKSAAQQATLNSLVSQLKTVTDSLTALTNTVNTEIASAKGKMETFESRLAATNGTVNGALQDIKTLMDRYNDLRTDGAALVNQVGALVSTITTTLPTPTPSVSQSATPVPTGLDPASVMNALLLGYTSEAAGLIVFAYEVNRSLQTTFLGLQSQYASLQQQFTALSAKMAATENKDASQDQALLALGQQLTALESRMATEEAALLQYESNNTAKQTQISGQVDTLTTSLNGVVTELGQMATQIQQQQIQQQQQTPQQIQQQQQTPVP